MNSELLGANNLFLKGEYERAAEIYHELARLGDADAAFNYGFCLWRGLGVGYDPTEAKSFFSYSRDLNGGEACYNLAMLYLHGEGVCRSYKTAYNYMVASARLGSVEAKLYLGMLYTTGYMLEPDVIGITRIPFHKPIYRDPDTYLLMGETPDAEADEEARFSVAEADARRAFEYFRSAAHADPTYVKELVAKGQYLYAKCYVDGLGTEPSFEKGARLMLAAGKSGSTDAVEFLTVHGIRPELLLGSKTPKKPRK